MKSGMVIAGAAIVLVVLLMFLGSLLGFGVAVFSAAVFAIKAAWTLALGYAGARLALRHEPRLPS